MTNIELLQKLSAAGVESAQSAIAVLGDGEALAGLGIGGELQGVVESLHADLIAGCFNGGFICKQCGQPAPLGVGYAVDGVQAWLDSQNLAQCACGHSVKPASFDAALSFDQLQQIECERTAINAKRRVMFDVLRRSGDELAEHFEAMTPDDVNLVLAQIAAYRKHLQASLAQAEQAYSRALLVAEQVLPEPDSSEHVFVNYSGQSGFSVNTFGLPAGYMNFDVAGLLEDVLNERPVSSFSGSLAALRSELQDMAGLQAALSIVEPEDMEWLSDAVTSIEAGISRWCVEQARGAL